MRTATWQEFDRATARRTAAQTVETRAGGFAVQADKRATLDLAHRPSAVAGPESKRSSGRRGAAACSRVAPFGSARGGRQLVHAVPELRQRLPCSRAGRQPRETAAQVHRERTACSAACVPAPVLKRPSPCSRACGWPMAARRARRPRVLAEMEPYRCVRCSKPFGTLRAIENMVSQAGRPQRLPGRAAAERLEDVRRLPRDRPAQQPATKSASPTCEARPMSSTDP